MSNNNKKYDDKGNVIYRLFPGWDDLEEWYKYDDNNNMIYAKDSKGFKIWKEYDEENRKIHYRDNKGDKDPLLSMAGGLIKQMTTMMSQENTQENTQEENTQEGDTEDTCQEYTHEEETICKPPDSWADMCQCIQDTKPSDRWADMCQESSQEIKSWADIASESK